MNAPTQLDLDSALKEVQQPPEKPVKKYKDGWIGESACVVDGKPWAPWIGPKTSAGIYPVRNIVVSEVKEE